jgi:hypothetical protein
MLFKKTDQTKHGPIHEEEEEEEEEENDDVNCILCNYDWENDRE